MTANYSLQKRNQLAGFIFSFCALLLSGCASTAYFSTPNDVHKIKGTVYLLDGSTKKGLITISLEVKQLSDNDISIIPDGSEMVEKINFKNIKYYSIDTNVYVPKIIDLALNKDYHYLFLKRLTKEDDKIQFYELPQSYKSNDAGEPRSYYYFALPYFSRYEVVDINSEKVVPGFEYKMSDYVSGCAMLADKIKTKTPGYYYGFLAGRGEKLQVMKKIVKEYNECR